MRLRGLCLFVTNLVSVFLLGCGTSSSDPAPAANGAAVAPTGGSVVAPALSYKGVAGDIRFYDVKIEAEEEKHIVSLTGRPILAVLSSTSDSLNVSMNGSLQESSRPRSGQLGGINIPQHSGPFSPFGGTSPFSGGIQGHSFSIDLKGKVLNRQGSSQLPYALGNLSDLLIEPLPAGNESSWTFEDATILNLYSQNSIGPFRHSRPIMPGDHKEQYTLKQKDEYRVTKVEGDLVTIQKTLHFWTKELTNGKSFFEQTGSGEFVFNTTLGVITKFDMKMTAFQRDGQTSHEQPLTIHFELVSADRGQIAPPGSTSPQTPGVAGTPVPSAVALPDSFATYQQGSPCQKEGEPITAETPLRRGQYVQLKFGSAWFPGMVMDVMADGRVWVHRSGIPHCYDDEAYSRTNLRQAPNEINVPFTTEELAQILNDLKSGGSTAQSACAKLKVKGPMEPSPEIAAALCQIISGTDTASRRAAADALVLWSTAESIPTLMNMVGDSDTQLQSGGCLALTAYKTDEAIEKVAALIPVGSTQRYYASPALRFMGPQAEPTAIKMLDHSDYKARRDSSLALVVMGSETSLPKLKELVTKKDQASSYAQRAVQAIEQRLAAKK